MSYKITSNSSHIVDEATLTVTLPARDTETVTVSLTHDGEVKDSLAIQRNPEPYTVGLEGSGADVIIATDDPRFVLTDGADDKTFTLTYTG
jgi:hypothetical protein